MNLGKYRNWNCNAEKTKTNGVFYFESQRFYCLPDGECTLGWIVSTSQSGLVQNSNKLKLKNPSLDTPEYSPKRGIGLSCTNSLL